VRQNEIQSDAGKQACRCASKLSFNESLTMLTARERNLSCTSYEHGALGPVLLKRNDNGNAGAEI
jgi:hypothetical protein